MNKTEILKTLDDISNRYHLYKLAMGDMQIVYGAAMVIDEIKAFTNDIDIRCNLPAWKFLHEVCELEDRPYKGDDEVRVISIGNVDFFPPVSNMITMPECAVVSGWYVQTPMSLLIEKVLRYRPKDQADIQLIKQFILNGFNGAD